MKRILFVAIIIFAYNSFRAQELNCEININTEQIQGTVNKQIFDQMKRSIFEFMNGTRWTNEVYGNQEKIEASILIIITGVVGQDEYTAKIQATCRRPVYKSSYNSILLNVEDEYFQFKFQQFTQLEFNLNVFQNNLTSVLQFYAYAIIALDNDSFSPLGGTSYWQKAQLVVQNAPATDVGWRSNQQSQDNRYWIAENSLQPVFKGIRECMYHYHRQGLDKMFQNPEEGRAEVMKALEMLKPVYTARPASFPMQMFFNAKRDEIINIFKGATPEEKNKVMELLMSIDPAGTTRYQKIQG